jgi:hypothetical protein
MVNRSLLGIEMMPTMYWTDRNIAPSLNLDKAIEDVYGVGEDGRAIPLEGSRIDGSVHNSFTRSAIAEWNKRQFIAGCH